MTSTVDLPSGGNVMTFDRGRLATAVLVLIDAPDDQAAARRLRTDYGFATDAIVYAVGARYCIENGIEP